MVSAFVCVVCVRNIKLFSIRQKHHPAVISYFCLYLDNVDTSANHVRNAPVGGHTCITAGEQGEPAVVLYERINLSVPVGGPTALGYATNCFNLSGRCGSSYGDR